jgi:FkbM family methyltransferase
MVLSPVARELWAAFLHHRPLAPARINRLIRGIHRRSVGGTAEAPMRQGYRMLCDLDVSEQRDAFDGGAYDAATLDRCLRLLPAGGVALDIGANVGFYGCAFGVRLRESGGRVFAFEPVRATCDRLRENVFLNGLDGVVAVSQTALGAAPGELVMHVVPDGATANAVGDNMLSPQDRVSVAEKGFRSEKVPVERLDDWAAARGVARCDLIKIDVEGAELLVFEGGRGLLERHRPVILGEFNPYWMLQLGQTLADARAFFEPMGYRFFRDLDGRPAPLTEALIAVPPEVPSYWLVPEEKLALFSR